MASKWLTAFLYFIFRESGVKTIQESAKLDNFPENFKVIWSVPFEPCFKRLPENITDVLVKAGITINEGGKFGGSEIRTFYRLGFYPEITDKGDINGGIPQLVNINAHLGQVIRDIEDAIPNENFSGLALIDWESWRPFYDFNFDSLRKYQERSIEIVESQHPDWPQANVTKEASKQWNSAAKNFMERTLLVAKKLRPQAKWCFYGFPDCYNYYGKSEPQEYFCGGNIVEGNNQLEWMWGKSSALCPSLYLRNKILAEYNLTQRAWYTHGRILEMVRVSGLNSPIYPYINYYVFDGGRTVPRADFARLISQPAAAGTDGVVIWGSSNNVKTKDDCQILYDYINDIIVPAYKTMLKNLRLCSETICGGIGKCVWDKRSYDAWKVLYAKNPKFRPQDIKCVFKPTMSTVL